MNRVYYKVNLLVTVISVPSDNVDKSTVVSVSSVAEDSEDPVNSVVSAKVKILGHYVNTLLRSLLCGAYA